MTLLSHRRSVNMKLNLEADKTRCFTGMLHYHLDEIQIDSVKFSVHFCKRIQRISGAADDMAEHWGDPGNCLAVFSGGALYVRLKRHHEFAARFVSETWQLYWRNE